MSWFSFWKKKPHHHLPRTAGENEELEQAKRLLNAINLGLPALREQDPELARIMSAGTVHSGVEGLEMGVAVLLFPMADGTTETFAFTWDWLDARDDETIFADVAEQVAIRFSQPE